VLLNLKVQIIWHYLQETEESYRQRHGAFNKGQTNIDEAFKSSLNEGRKKIITDSKIISLQRAQKLLAFDENLLIHLSHLALIYLFISVYLFM